MAGKPRKLLQFFMILFSGRYVHSESVWCPQGNPHCRMCCHQVYSGVCFIKEDIHCPTVDFEWDGDVVIDENVTLRFEGAARLAATAGKVKLLEGSEISSSNGSLEIWSTSAHDAAIFGDATRLLAPKGFIFIGSTVQSASILLKQSMLMGENVTLECVDGSVMIDAQSSMTATGHIHTSITATGHVRLLASAIQLHSRAVKIEASAVTIEARDDARLEATISASAAARMEAAGTTATYAETAAPHLPGQIGVIFVSVGGTLYIGKHGGPWEATVVRAMAESILVAVADKFIQTHGSRCDGERLSVMDQCPLLEASKQSWTTLSPSLAKFDLVLFAQKKIQMGQQAAIYAASMLMCALDEVELHVGVKLDSSGRGCGAGFGQRAGKISASDSDKWCAGGGSGLGAGGAGGSSQGQVTSCADAGPVEASFSPVERPSLLPPPGASGGGCDMPREVCSELPNRYSAGGGLVLLSAGQLTLSSGVKILANGIMGYTQTVTGQVGGKKSQDKRAVSGGGAGGQILLFIGNVITVPASDFSVELSARGGDGKCKEMNAWSGAGGGGFIGLLWTTQQPTSNGKNLKERIDMKVIGGNPDDSCGLQEEEKNMMKGEAGLASHLQPCNRGFGGAFCTPCGLGFWSEGADCRKCEGIPEHSHYIQDVWTNRKCPYECVPGVPPRVLNEKCDSLSVYAGQFFGENLILLFIAVAFFLCVKVLLSHSADICGRRPDKDSACLHRQHLPKHLKRFYLLGQGSPECPFSITQQPPESVKHLVSNNAWQTFALELNGAATIPRMEARSVALLSVFYRPLASLIALWCRQYRAKALQTCVNAFSEGLGGREVVWRGQFVGGGPSGKKLRMMFGYDEGATLAFIDFLDLAIPPCDWVLADLREEAWLLVSRGNGSYFEPWSIDVEDPLMQQLIQFGFNTDAVHNVVFALNNAARSLPADQHLWAPYLIELQNQVEKCATECGLKGSVKVLVLEQSPEQPAAAEASRSRCSVGGDGSFTTLVGRLRSDARRRETCHTATLPPMDYKLCLAFVDSEAPSGWEAMRPSALPSAAQALSVPISFVSLSKHVLKESSTLLLDQARTRTQHRRATDHGNLSIMTWFHERTTSGPAARMLVRLFLGILVSWDVAWFLVLSRLIFLLSRIAFWVWMLFPPFAPLLATILNVMFILLDRPRLGRLAVSLTWFSLRNLACFVGYRAVAGVVFQNSSCCFDLFVVAVVGIVKGGLILCAHSHCLNLETARDLGFSKVSKLPEFERQASRSDSISTTRTLSAVWPSFGGRRQGSNTAHDEGVSLAVIARPREAGLHGNSSAATQQYVSAIRDHAAPF